MSPSLFRCARCQTAHGTAEVLQKHYFDSPYHPVCISCHLGFEDGPMCDEHMYKSHPTIQCIFCGDTIHRAERQEHYLNSPQHPTCAVCQLGFPNATLYEQHKKSVHSDDFICACSQSVRRSDLEQHYLDSPSHPVCTICRVGFVNSSAHTQHMAQTHPTVECKTCKKAIPQSEIQQHYTDAPEHPTCYLCNIGFENDGSYDEHVAFAHPEMRCQSCYRQFHSTDLLQRHYYYSAAHPSCELCELGFKDDYGYDEHMDLTHPDSPNTSPTSSFKCNISSEGSSPHKSDLPKDVGDIHQSSPVPLCFNDVSSAVDSIIVTTAQIPGPDDVYTPERSAFVIDTTIPVSIDNAEYPSPIVAGSSSLIPGDLGGVTSSLSDKDVSQNSLVHSIRVDDAVSTAQLTSCDDNNIVAPIDPVSEVAVGISTIPPISISGGRSSLHNSVTLSARLGPSSRPHSPEASPPSLTRSESKSSVTSLFSRLCSLRSPKGHGMEASGSTRRSLTDRPAPHRWPRRRTLGAVLGVSDESLIIDTTPFIPSPALTSWHCRQCMKDSCLEPTITMCGHLFCRSCIVKEILENMRCPVCKMTALVQLHV